jgi:glutamine amidotransferase
MSSTKTVAIIDYKMGNMYSVQHSCEHVGLDPKITSDSEFILEADAAILPGVGAFGQAMQHLEDLNLINTIYEFIESGRPFMGICLGFQLLFSSSEEFGDYEGLDLIKGNVKKFPTEDGTTVVKVPQIGWNKIHFPNGKKNNTPFEEIEDGAYMYFVHSYYVDIHNTEMMQTFTEYGGIDYCSSILKENIFGTQFHPEKSGELGVEIYKKWASTI